MSRPIAAAIRSTRSGSKVAPQAIARRVDRRAVGGEPGQALLVHQRRDAAAGRPSSTTRCCRTSSAAPSAGGDRGAAVDPGEVAEAVPARLLQRQRRAGGEDVLHRRDVEACRRPSVGRPRPAACRCRPTGCRAGRPSPRGSSRRAGGRPARRPAARCPATAGARSAAVVGSGRVTRAPSAGGCRVFETFEDSRRDLASRHAAQVPWTPSIPPHSAILLKLVHSVETETFKGP